jgi:hypothetical protein
VLYYRPFLDMGVHEKSLRSVRAPKVVLHVRPPGKTTNA